MDSGKWKILREQFYKECTTETPKNILLKKVNLAPHDLFEWFKTNINMLCDVNNKQTSVSGLNKHFVNGSCTDRLHKRQITEKELKITAKEIKLQYGLIDYIIRQVRTRQEKSGNCR